MNLNFLYIWLAVMLVVSVAAPLIRKKRNKPGLDTQDFMVAGFALGSALALVKVLIKLITQEKLQADLDWDGTIALCISSGLGIFLSLKEVLKLF
jgi:lysylphosphatidylglycerol synthetase-like protein (DUF2156 family)